MADHSKPPFTTGPPQGPITFQATPDSILQDAHRIIERSHSLHNRIVSDVPLEDATFENVLLPFAHDENARLAESRVLGFFESASLDADLRDASRKAKSLLQHFEVQYKQRQDLFQLINAVSDRTKAQPGSLDPESEHYVSTVRREFVKNGLGIPAGPQRERFTDIQHRINDLKAQFAENAANASQGGVWFSRDELEGVPEKFLSTMEIGDNGKLRATFLEHVGPIFRFATRPETRKRMYIAKENNCNDNVPVFSELTRLRDEAARLLGYPSHAAFVVEDRMARDTETVHSLLKSLRTGLMFGGLKELEHYKRVKEADLKARGEAWDNRFYLWDMPYYGRLLRAQELAVHHDEIAEYFPLEVTMAGMLDMMGHLFGLVFSEVRPDDAAQRATADMVWHPDVRTFRVWNTPDEGSSFAGYLYLDLYAREFKPANPGCYSLIPGHLRSDGSRVYPSVALLCGFPKLTSTKPSLLEHQDVITLFHELGHGIHDLVSKTTYARFHGSAGTVVDFGEAPSQMLENWFRVPSQLKQLSRHYTSLSAHYLAAWQQQRKADIYDNDSLKTSSIEAPERHLPDDLINKLLQSRGVNKALTQLHELVIATWDFTVNDQESHDACNQLNISSTYNRIRRELFPLDGPWHLGDGDEWSHPYTSMRGIACGDYNAGYYGYLLSEVYAADVFSTFFAQNPTDASQGRRYRHALLEKGGSRPEMETLLMFLGRQPSPKALYRSLGVNS
ncbi:hypothetical protein OQA88_6942 [Cercophora sp. LCS_1]